MVEIHGMTNVYGSEIGEGTRVAAFVEIGRAKVGRKCSIQAFVFICPGVTIGDEVFIGPRVTFTNVKVPRAYRKGKFAGTVVKNRATIGAGAVILPGVTIGEYALVGAGAVVTKDVEPRSVVMGNPARHVRYVKDEEA